MRSLYAKLKAILFIWEFA